MIPNEPNTKKCETEEAVNRFEQLLKELAESKPEISELSEAERDKLVIELAESDAGPEYGCCAKLLIYLGRELKLDLLTSMRVLALALDTTSKLAYEQHQRVDKIIHFLRGMKK